MFDMMKVAKKIKEQRIKKNMTQMNLADEIGVSYQAVSNWERGNAMPDIGKLGELARIFDCSIDELLGESKETVVVNKILHAQEQGEVPDIDIKEMGSVAPILEPKQTKSIIGELISNYDNFTIHDMVAIAPFLDEESMDQLIEDAKIKGKFKDFIGLAPFLSSKSINKIVEDITAEDEIDMKTLIGLAPFLPTETLDTLVDRLTDKDLGHKMVGLFPFLSSASRKKLAEECMKNGDFKLLTALAPFIS